MCTRAGNNPDGASWELDRISHRFLQEVCPDQAKCYVTLALVDGHQGTCLVKKLACDLQTTFYANLNLF